MLWQTQKEQVKEKLNRYTALNEMIHREQRNVTGLKIRVQDAEVGHQIIKDMVQQMQESAHQQIAAIVTDCLQTIFGPRLMFRIRFEQKRNKTEAIMEVVTIEGHAINPMRACGGGVVDVISFALRVCALVLTQPAYRRLLVLDEPFKHLSNNYSQSAAELVQKLADDLQIQFIIVTHNSNMKLGKVIHIK